MHHYIHQKLYVPSGDIFMNLFYKMAANVKIYFIKIKASHSHLLTNAICYSACEAMDWRHQLQCVLLAAIIVQLFGDRDERLQVIDDPVVMETDDAAVGIDLGTSSSRSVPEWTHFLAKF